MHTRLGCWLGVLVALIGFLGCETIQSHYREEKLHKVRVTTDPPGARVWELTGAGRQELGQAPLEIQRRYYDDAYKSWDDSFGITLGGAIPTAIALTLLGLAGFPPPSLDDVLASIGWVFVGTGGIFMLVGLGSFIATAASDPEDADDEPVPYQLVAAMPGYDEKQVTFQLGFKAGGAPLDGATGLARMRMRMHRGGAAGAGAVVAGAKDAPVEVHIALVERWWERYGMKTEEEKTQPGAVPALRRALGDKKEVVRREAAQCLAAIGPPAQAAVAELGMLLGDPDVRIRQAAIAALAAIGAPDSRAIEGLRRVYELDDDPAARKAARAALQKLSLLRISTEKPEAPAPEKKAAPAAVVIVAVIDVADASGKFGEDILVQLTVFLSTALTKTGRYQVVPRDKLRAGLLEQKKESYLQCMDASCQIELGKAVAANKLVSTQLLQVGNKCAVTANLYDLKTETTQKGAMVQTGCTPDELLDAMQKIADQL